MHNIMLKHTHILAHVIKHTFVFLSMQNIAGQLMNTLHERSLNWCVCVHCMCACVHVLILIYDTCTFVMVCVGPVSVLSEWNWDRNSSTICGRGTPAGSFIDGCMCDGVDMCEMFTMCEGVICVCGDDPLTLVFQRSRGNVSLSRFCSNIIR